jgi:hypothetical protein
MTTEYVSCQVCELPIHPAFGITVHYDCAGVRKAVGRDQEHSYNPIRRRSILIELPELELLTLMERAQAQDIDTREYATRLLLAGIDKEVHA